MEETANENVALDSVDSLPDSSLPQTSNTSINNSEGAPEGALVETVIPMPTPTGPTVSFHKITYKVKVRTKPCCGEKSDKYILQEISGIFKPGMNAILGPTGSGKTSLLDVIAGRKDPTGLSGDVLIDGAPQPDNFKCMSGYVVQDDVVMGTLTVRENFHFSASLRLSSSVSNEEKKRRVDDIISDLGLGHCADTKVGTEMIRGVSGGERKRCNIGMELIIQPSILFLDEPTTGLDASTANAVMMLLRRLALKGNVVIFSIHQPRYSIYRLFDSLMLLAQGHCVYHGAASEALEYFSSIGYECEEHNNPPDFFLDVINGDSTALAVSKGEGERKTDEAQGSSDLSSELAEAFKQSKWQKMLTDNLRPIEEKFTVNDTQGTHFVMKASYATSFFTQLGVVSGRAVKNIFRNPQTSFMQVVVIALFAVIVGAIYWDLDTSLKSGIQNRVGAFFFVVLNMVFGNLSAVELFIKERNIFVHENASGFYRVSSYFLAKVFCDLLPMRGIPVIVFSIISYWMIGFQRDAGKFFFYMLNLILTTMAASGLAFSISASVGILAVATLLISMAYVFMMVFSGLLVNLDSIGEYVGWIKYFSIMRYSLDALSINELKDAQFCDYGVNGTATCQSGNYYLDQQGIKHETLWDVWQTQVALACMTLIFMFLAYVQLRRMKKLK